MHPKQTASVRGDMPMKIRYIAADPAGNKTGLVLCTVAPPLRAQIAVQMMEKCPEGFEQIAFVDEASMEADSGRLPRMDMMGGEFCGNATRAFGLLAAIRRGLDACGMEVSVSGAQQPVRVQVDAARGEAYADMPLPGGFEIIHVRDMELPVVRMEGIAHAVVFGVAPSQDWAHAVLAAMPREDAQGVLFAQEGRMTPLVYVRATDSAYWESSCGSGSAALAWLLAKEKEDGEHSFTFHEPGGTLHVRVMRKNGVVTRICMGGDVTLSEERSMQTEEKG